MDVSGLKKPPAIWIFSPTAAGPLPEDNNLDDAIGEHYETSYDAEKISRLLGLH
ncbi:hypothetical protein BGW41_007460 [Actinomortierella wolfii]|nr:hypothetical protein BGW41_007460 [Actinomortierella wolfii]